MKEKQKVVDYLKELTKKVEESQCKVTCDTNWEQNDCNVLSDGMFHLSYCNRSKVVVNINFDYNTPLKAEFEAKKGDFVVVDGKLILQMNEDFDGVGVFVNGLGSFRVDEIREATEEEKQQKIEAFKSCGWIEGECGIWREPKLEEVYCVAESKADLIRIYSVRPELISEGSASLNTKCPNVMFMDHIWNSSMTHDRIKVSIDKFIELIKKA